MIGNGRIQVGCLAAVGIPALTAFISGVIFGLLAASLSLWSEENIQNRWLIMFTFSMLGMLLSWPFALSFWGRLLAGDNPFEQKPARSYSYTTRLEIHSNQSRQINIVELPISPEQLRNFARGVLSGRSLSEAAWIGDGFTRSDFVGMRDELIVRGLAEWISDADHARGWQLTKPGMAAMRYFASKQSDRNHSPISDTQPLNIVELA